MNTEYGNCPNCKKPVHLINIVSIPATYAEESETFRAIGLTCPECNCIISTQIYPWETPDDPGGMRGI